jgi:hypothetical protein
MESLPVVIVTDRTNEMKWDMGLKDASAMMHLTEW